MTDDFSDYERIRLANIQRNNQFLLSLGLGDSKRSLDVTDQDSLVEKKPKISASEKFQQKKFLPSRRSERISNIKSTDDTKKTNLKNNNNSNIEGHDVNTNESDDYSIDYKQYPLEPRELDDLEFQVFIALRKWRLKRCRELDIEPYKVFQNRTLYEAVRRRRNDPQWAKPLNTLRKSKKNNEEEKQNDFIKVSNDLSDCWGIGPAKVKVDGFGHELANLLNENELSDKLEKSRLEPQTVS